MTKVYSARYANYPELIITQYKPESKHRIVPHKYVQILCINQKTKISFKFHLRKWE
jgi:hypothetical protein